LGLGVEVNPDLNARVLPLDEINLSSETKLNSADVTFSNP
jgi:hypothetical protein